MRTRVLCCPTFRVVPCPLDQQEMGVVAVELDRVVALPRRRERLDLVRIIDAVLADVDHAQRQVLQRLPIAQRGPRRDADARRLPRP
eukprot:1027639-Prymnesium_polylepis.1